MTIQDTYKFGSVYVDANLTVENLDDSGLLTDEVGEVLEVFQNSGADFEFDGDYPHGKMYDNGEQLPLVLIGHFGGYPGESIDEANAQAAKEWAEGRDYIYSFSNWFGGCESVALYFDPSVGTLEDAVESVELAEGFLDYPVLDESLWSEMEMKVWDDMIEENIGRTEQERESEFTEEQKDAIRELASEKFGYWDEGYFAWEDWQSIISEVTAEEPGTVIQSHQGTKLW